MFQKRIRPIFFRAKKMWGFHCDPSLPWTKGLEGKWFCHPERIFYFHVKLWLAWLVLLYACFTLFFLTGFFCEKLMVVHLIDIRSSGWKVFPKIGSEYFFSGGVTWKKKSKLKNSEMTRIWNYFHMKNDNTRISGLHRNFTFSGKIIALIPVIF